jgi:hypothetical protein
MQTRVSKISPRLANKRTTAAYLGCSSEREFDEAFGHLLKPIPGLRATRFDLRVVDQVIDQISGVSPSNVRPLVDLLEADLLQRASKRSTR